jgi:hypothetical protein
MKGGARDRIKTARHRRDGLTKTPGKKPPEQRKERRNKQSTRSTLKEQAQKPPHRPAKTNTAERKGASGQEQTAKGNKKLPSLTDTDGARKSAGANAHPAQKSHKHPHKRALLTSARTRRQPHQEKRKGKKARHANPPTAARDGTRKSAGATAHPANQPT